LRCCVIDGRFSVRVGAGRQAGAGAGGSPSFPALRYNSVLQGGCRMTHDEMDEVIRHFDVVMEAVRSDVRAIGDGHVMLSEKIDHLGHEMVGLKEQTAKLDVGLAAVATRTERVEKAVVTLTDRTDRLEHELIAFRAETQHSFAELRAMLKLSYAEIEGRVTRLEGALTEVLGRLERIEKGTPS